MIPQRSLDEDEEKKGCITPEVNKLMVGDALLMDDRFIVVVRKEDDSFYRKVYFSRTRYSGAV